MNQAQWSIRNAKSTDIEFIYATWLNSFHYDSWAQATTKSVFFHNYKRVIDKILLDYPVYIACLNDDEDIILGYMVANKDTKIIQYCFVKDGFRQIGVAKSLYNNLFKPLDLIQYAHKTRKLVKIVRDRSSLIFNPFINYKQE